MTRINVAIPVEELTREHLIAEHREIKRIPNMVKSGRAILENIPSKFTLGKGHVKFFYDKLLYLKIRYDQLYNEGLRRGYNFTYFGSAWEEIPKELMNDYIPTKHDEILIRRRIADRLHKPK